jgi:enoyl-CoA hydratase
MAYANILTEQQDDLLIVTLDCPERLNALSLAMRADLLDCMLKAEAESSVRAIVITGSGSKSFSAGTHIPELEDRTLYSEMSRDSELRKVLPTTIERLGKPTVAAINGYCLGGGLELVLGCTVRIASQNAKLGLPEITLGQIPGSGGTQRLYRFVGLGWAMQLVLTGEPITAEHAQRIGLVTEVLGLGELLPRAKQLARLLGSRAPMAFSCGRDAVLRSTDLDLLNGLDYEKKLYAICMATEDSRAGLRAYAEKRPAVYSGK